jgi:hypothetical protein
MRHGVGESERHEINCALLLPMWQAIRSETNIRVRIEKAQLGHRKAKSIKRRGGSENSKTRSGGL